MNTFNLATILSSLSERNVADMTDDELSVWLMTCEVMERRSRISFTKTGQDWKSSRRATESEIARRRQAPLRKSADGQVV
jgi:hypothetical protein